MKKVRGPCVVTLCDRIPPFEWYMARLVIKNGHQQDMCHYHVGLCAQYTSIILGSIVYANGREPYMIV